MLPRWIVLGMFGRKSLIVTGLVRRAVRRLLWLVVAQWPHCPPVFWVFPFSVVGRSVEDPIACEKDGPRQVRV